MNPFLRFCTPRCPDGFNLTLQQGEKAAFVGEASYELRIPGDSVFCGPVRENLVLGKEVSEEELIGVLKKVRLDSLFQELEGGVDIRIGEHE